MFERYSESARRILFFARMAASRFCSGTNQIETEHLVLAMVGQRSSLLHRLLNFDERDRLRTQLEASMPCLEHPPVDADLSLTQECQQVLHAAAELAAAAGDSEVSGAHLLMAVLRHPRSFAAELLRNRGITEEKVELAIANPAFSADAESAARGVGTRSNGGEKARATAPPAAPDDPHSYDRFAAVYNRHMAEDWVWRAFPLVQRVLLRHVPPRAELLDACCGTGQMARSLTERGYRVTGIDASEEMLRYARENAPMAEFRCQDVRRFDSAERFAAAISTFNSLAHIPSYFELVEVLRNVHAALVEGGLFLFDLAMEEAYATRWRGAFSIVEPDCVCVVQPTYNALTRMGHNAVTVFLPRGDLWERSELDIAQRCYSHEEVYGALEAAGFVDVRHWDAQRELDMAGEVGRSFFLARKGGRELVDVGWAEVT